MNFDDLLFSDLDGNRTDLQDVIYDGFDRDYSARHPALLHLLREGLPSHQVYACAMLTSWGVPEGLQTIRAWAGNPNGSPWASDPFTFDRFFGVDAAWVLLAEAVYTSADCDHRDDIEPMRVATTRALLRIYHRVYFDRSIFILLDVDRRLAEQVIDETRAAIDRTTAAARDRKMVFDLATQAAFLIGPVATFDDQHAARAAEELLATQAGQIRTLGEVAYGLGFGAGPATGAILERLLDSPHARVRQDAHEALARRSPRDEMG